MSIHYLIRQCTAPQPISASHARRHFHRGVIAALVVAVSLVSTHSTQAQTFDFRAESVEAIDGSTTMMLTSGGITATVTATGGVLNVGANGFGVQSIEDAFPEWINVAEQITITFDADVTISAVNISGQSESGCMRIIVSAQPQVIFCGSGNITPVIGIAVTANTGQIVLDPADTAGFSLDSITVMVAVDPDDLDGDGVPNADDPAPNDSAICGDSDGDGCDDCGVSHMFDPGNDGPDKDGDGLCNSGDPDIDGDTVANEIDPDPMNGRICGDSDGDGCDDCSNDGVPNPARDGRDSDGDGLCDSGDPDRDGDTILNEDDPDPDNAFICGDRDGDGCDDCHLSGGPPDTANDGADSDGNGICDAADGGDPEVIVFDTRDPALREFNANSSFTIQRGQLKAYFESQTTGNFFQSDSGFGIRGIADIADRIDGNDEIAVVFNYDVEWVWLDVQRLEANQCAEFEIGEQGPFTVCTNGRSMVAGGVIIERIPGQANNNSLFRLRPTGGSVLSLDGFAVKPRRALSQVEIELQGLSSVGSAFLGDTLNVTFTIDNDSYNDADDIVIDVQMPPSLEINAISASDGSSYDESGRRWTIPHLTGSRRRGADFADHKTLRFDVTVRPGGGDGVTCTAEIISLLQTNHLGVPGNGNVEEDDHAVVEIVITSADDIPEPPNPLLLPLLYIFSCGAFQLTMVTSTLLGTGMMKRWVRRRRSLQ